MISPSQTLKWGLLMLPHFQWLDAVGPVDLINTHSQATLKHLQFPEALVAKAPIIHWSYISHDLSPMIASSGPPQTPTETYKTCPQLDYLIIPGPDPDQPLPEGCAEFLKRQFGGLKALITVCTGSLAIASTGLLDGLQVCSNKFVLRSMAQNGSLNKNVTGVDDLYKTMKWKGELNKKVSWVGDRRWVVDGKVWSAAGVTAGMDLAAEFVRVHFDEAVVNLAKQLMEFEGKKAQPDPWASIMDGVDLN